MNPSQTFDNPLVDRYAGEKMAQLWSPQRKFSTWRRLWVALAEALHARPVAHGLRPLAARTS